MKIDHIQVGDFFKFQLLDGTNNSGRFEQPEYVELVFKDQNIIVYRWDVNYFTLYIRQIKLDSFELKPQLVEFFTVLSVKEHGTEYRLNAAYPMQNTYECELLVDRLIDYDDVLQVMKVRIYQEQPNGVFKIETLSTRVKG